MAKGRKKVVMKAKARRPGQRSGRMPAFRPVQLATLVDYVPTGDRWLHEMKYDGYRCLIAVGGAPSPQLVTATTRIVSGRNSKLCIVGARKTRTNDVRLLQSGAAGRGADDLREALGPLEVVPSEASRFEKCRLPRICFSAWAISSNIDCPCRAGASARSRSVERGAWRPRRRAARDTGGQTPRRPALRAP
jgi:hypothetical protein